MKPPRPPLKRRTVIQSTSTALRLSFTGIDHNRAASNAAGAPYYCAEGKPALMSESEANTISRLLDVCAQYEQQGDTHLSEIVDRIGLSLMQVFLMRAHVRPQSHFGANGPETPSQNIPSCPHTPKTS